MDLDPSTDQELNPAPPERTTLNLSEQELKERLPSTTKQAYGTLQLNRIKESLERTRTASVADFIRLSGFKGALKANFQGLSISVKAGVSEYIVPNPAHVEEVKAAYAAPHKVLNEALAAGVATRTERPDFHVALKRPEKQELPKDNSLIESLIESCPDKEIEATSTEISQSFPTLFSTLYCHIQKKKLEAGLKKGYGKALQELEEYPETNINTSLNHQEARISTFKTPKIDLLPNQPEWEAKLDAARKESDIKLKELLQQGKAKKDRTFYLTVSIAPKTPKLASEKEKSKPVNEEKLTKTTAQA